MRVVVITPADRPHTRTLCATIASQQDLAAVLIPGRPHRTAGDQVRRVRAETRRLGVVDETLRLLAARRSPVRGWDIAADESAALAREFPRADELYADAGIREERVQDVNSPASIELIVSLRPDVVCCLGGPIYRPQLISAVPLMLNHHAGLSPLYNGAQTIAFPFANGHLRLCGGTLMTMSAAVDGGDILAHVLPEIRAGDTPGTIFARTVHGGIGAYAQLLRHLDAGDPLAGAPQPPPLFYVRASDWTVSHGHRVRRLVAADAGADAARPGRVARYWDSEDRDAARARVRETLAPLVGL